MIGSVVKKILNRFGYNIQQIVFHKKYEKMSTSLFDNLHTHVISISIDKNIRTYRGISLSNYENDLYVNSAMIAHHNSFSERRFIEKFVSNVNSMLKINRSMSEAFNLPERKDLMKIPECYSVLPWQNMTFEEKRGMYMKTFIKRRGLSNSINHDSLFYSNEAWASHAGQFYKLILSIKKNGFNYFSFPVVDVLVKEGDFKYIMSSIGNHRLISAFVAGVDSVNARLGNFIDIKDVDNWTNVKNGFFSRSEAEKIFLDYFNGCGYGSSV